eukprot:CAMPEP_0174914616 /NCGR_PEP_ID=MMETSP0167-20121228/80933_1 /TAXON_ID=38298 /ORGANISM="Rhodella maculata, Strain CCMP736" /LENGTH=102 /DNA_ID=CAMNT_0016159385 /DNA_START=685 /DNA_END=993 /DNA_ORIENTATION=+
MSTVSRPKSFSWSPTPASILPAYFPIFIVVTRPAAPSLCNFGRRLNLATAIGGLRKVKPNTTATASATGTDFNLSEWKPLEGGEEAHPGGYRLFAKERRILF